MLFVFEVLGKCISVMLYCKGIFVFLGIESTFEEYQEFCEEIDPNVEKTFEKSKEKLKILTPFEDALVCKYFSKFSVIFPIFIVFLKI